MTTLPPSTQHHHRTLPPPPSSSVAQSAAPSGLAIATAVVRRLVREKSSYAVELAGQEARLGNLLLKSKTGEKVKEGGGGDEDEEDENWGYLVKQEVFFLRFFSLERGKESGVDWADCICRRRRWKRLERCLDR